MNRKRFFSGIAASAGMLLLILDSKTALSGAKAGIELCLQTVIPALFPFFVLSNVVTAAFAGNSLAVLRPLGRLCGIPKGAEAFLVTGFLGGYPVGAQTVAQAARDGILSREDARRMLAFCSNAGPAFLFGMASSLFPKPWMAWALWGIHILSAVLTSALFPSAEEGEIRLSMMPPVGFPEAMRRSLSAIASVCGWVVLFRVLISFLQRWVLWLLPVPTQICLIGALELTNGCCALAALPDISLRFLLCSGMLAMGGLCVTMQTISVTPGIKLDLYLLGKLCQTVISLALAAAVMSHLGPVIPVLALVFLPFLGERQKRCSFSERKAV